MAKKIRVSISSEVTLFAESGTAYRNVGVDNLRYLCPKENVYLKHILRRKYCFKKNYISGGASYPYFSVGYEVVAGDGKRYSARYINIPGQENGNRLRWIDTSNTQIYAITPRLDKASLQDTKENLARALQLIQSKPEVYRVLGINFFIPALKKNDLFEIQPAAVGYPWRESVKADKPQVVMDAKVSPESFWRFADGWNQKPKWWRADRNFKV